MPRINELPKREIEICRRLRAFRIGTKIPRTTFAAMAGIVGARLENCEAATSPVRYGVFAAINARFDLSPKWLVTGEGSSVDALYKDYFHIDPETIPFSLLSECYDMFLEKHYLEQEVRAEELLQVHDDELSKAFSAVDGYILNGELRTAASPGDLLRRVYLLEERLEKLKKILRSDLKLIFRKPDVDGKP